MELDSSTVWTAITGAGVSLATAIGIMWRLIVGRMNATEVRANDQQKDLLRLSGEVGELKGKQAGIEQLSEQVLQTVHDAVTQRQNDEIVKYQTQQLKTQTRKIHG